MASAPASSPIGDLPTELLVKIFESVDFMTAKTLRLVSKHFNDLTSAIVFGVLYFCPLRENLQAFINVGLHPVLSKHVKEIRYVNFRLDVEYTDFDRWKDIALHVSTKWLHPAYLWHYHYYNTAYYHHRHITYYRADASTLRNGIKQLPNLQDLTMILETSVAPEHPTGCRPILDRFRAKTLLMDPFEPSSAVAKSISRPQAAIFQGFGGTGVSLKRLSLNDMTTSYWEDSARPALFASIRETVKTVFANLNSLTINSWVGTTGTVDNPDSTISRFIEFLSAAPALEHLDLQLMPLKYRASNFRHFPYPIFTGLCNKLTMPRLRSLQLSDFEAEGTSFIAFIQRHKGTLACLRLRKICLSEDNPETVSSWAAGQEEETGASWECAMRDLQKVMKMLTYVDFWALEDQYLYRGFANMPESRSQEKKWNAQVTTYCRELAGYFLFPDTHPIPVLGVPTTLDCQTCRKSKFGMGHGEYNSSYITPKDFPIWPPSSVDGEFDEDEGDREDEDEGEDEEEEGELGPDGVAYTEMSSPEPSEDESDDSEVDSTATANHN